MKLDTIRKSKSERRGGAIVMISLMIVAFGGISVALVSVTTSSQREARHYEREISSRLVAEAGLNMAYLDLRNGGTGNVGSINAPVVFDNATYWVTAATDAAGRVTLTSTAAAQGVESQVAMILQTQQTPFFNWAAFGRDRLTMDSNARTDSYDSSVGTYASQATNGSGNSTYAHTNGDVGSNGDVTMKQNSKVWGDVVPGPTGTATILGNATVSGASTPATEPVDMPAIDIPVVGASGALTAAGNATITIGPGTVHYTSLLANTGSTIQVVGPTTLICNNLTMSSNSNFIVDATNGIVELYVIDNFLINSNVTMAATSYQSKDLRINLASDNVLDPGIDVDFVADTLSFASNSKLHGTVYAPQAKVTINSNFELFGSLVARTVTLDSNSRVHFDEDLLAHGLMGPPHYVRLSWRALD